MNYTRSFDILNPLAAAMCSVTIIGAGGIGSATAICLAKMGLGHLEIWDPDVVEDVNIPVQFLRISDIGIPKVGSVASLVRTLADTDIRVYPLAIDRSVPLSSTFVVSTVDSIASRKAVLTSLGIGRNWKYYLDARMGAETFQLYTVCSRDLDWYADLLEPLTDDNVPDEVCTAKATFYTAMIAAGHIGHTIKRLINQESAPKLLVHDIRTNVLITPMEVRDA